jgi:hypothetical protein
MFLKHLSPDRRRQRRQLLNTSVRILSAKGGMDAVGINISEVGMCLFTVANLPIDSELEVEFPTPGDAQRMRRRGTVRHRALYLYGIEFVRNSEQQPASYAVDSTPSTCSS